MMWSIAKTPEFDKWFRRLKDVRAKQRVHVLIRTAGLLGCSPDSKPVGEGVYEARLNTGPGYRLYYVLRNEAVLLLLIGGDKSSQKRDIAKARQLNKRYEEWRPHEPEE